MGKHKKRQRSRAPEARKEQGTSKNQWNPAGRAMLWGDLVILAVSSLLEMNGLISPQAGLVCTLAGLILLAVALWLLFGGKNGGARL